MLILVVDMGLVQKLRWDLGYSKRIGKHHDSFCLEKKTSHGGTANTELKKLKKKRNYEWKTAYFHKTHCLFLIISYAVSSVSTVRGIFLQTLASLCRIGKNAGGFRMETHRLFYIIQACACINYL